MNWIKTERHEDGVGDFKIQYNNDTIPQQISGEFLTKLIQDLSKEISLYFNRNNDHIFTRSETKCYPLIDQIFVNEHIQREYPVKRLNKKRGRLDLWIPRNDHVFAIELKLSHLGYDGYKEIYEKDCFLEKYDTVINQIKELKLDKSKYKEKDIIRIALHFLVLYSRDGDEIKQFNSDKSYLFDIIKKVEKKISPIEKALVPPPTFIAIWHLNEKLVIAPDHRGHNNPDKIAIYPSLCFIGYVLET